MQAVHVDRDRDTLARARRGAGVEAGYSVVGLAEQLRVGFAGRGGLGPRACRGGSDQIARGVADTLRAVGRRIPDDVALVGFDNWNPMTLGALPPLTSVDMCLEDVGRVAAELLLAAIGGERDRDAHTVPSRLVVRESSGGYPATGDV